MLNLYNREKIISLEEQMVAFGPRLTGSQAHENYISLLKNELTSMGYTVYSDKLIMKKRWEPHRWKLTIHTDNEDLEISNVTYYPYSGVTGPEGVNGKLFNAGKNIGNFLGSNNKIAIISMSIFEASVGLIFKKRSVYPEDFVPPKTQGSPVVASFVFAPMLGRAKLMGAKAVICIMHGCSSDNASNQYLPFITAYQNCPALWVDDIDGEKILKAAKSGGSATLILEANLTEKCPTETIYAILKGRNEKESIIINTHTDGTNAFEENGGIALLSLAKHFISKPIEERERTLIFSFVTGHFQIPQFGNPMMQATNKFLSRHKDLWNGRDGNIKAVAGVSIEHLGCTEWRDSDDHKSFNKISNIDPELVFVANSKLNNIYLKALEGRLNCKTLTLKPKNLIYFGEGQPMYMAGIPTISLVPGPDYLCTNSIDGYISKINYDLMLEQIETFGKVVENLDKLAVKDIGKCELFTYGLKF